MSLDKLIVNSKTYNDVLVHRRSCSKWPNTLDPETLDLDGEFCLDCFGGGLTKFSKNLIRELKLVKRNKK